PAHLHSFPTRRSSDLFPEGIVSVCPILKIFDDRLLACLMASTVVPFCLAILYNVSPDTTLYEVVSAWNGADVVPVGMINFCPMLDRKSTRLNSSHVKI